jgi:hypothetical protein
MQFTLITSAIAAAIGFGSAWQLQAWRMDAYKLEVTNDRISQQRTARLTLERSMQAVATAEASAATRSTRNRADAVRAGDSGNGLRIASTAAVRTANADTATCLASIAIYDELLNEVVGSGGRMAAEADGWENSALKLHGAWPK